MGRRAMRLAALSVQLNKTGLPCLTAEEAAKALRLKPQRVRRLMASFRIRSVLFRGRRYVMPAEVERVKKSR